jgi:hypothetical protein
MKRLVGLAGLVAFLLFGMPAFSQSILVGATGGASYGNLFLGPAVEIELPFGEVTHQNFTHHPCTDFPGVYADNGQKKECWGFEVPATYNRFELDLRDEFAPLEEHIALGHGFANTGGAGPTVWLKQKFGLNGYVDSSLYSVQKASKFDGYWFAGIATRGIWEGSPVRITLDYFREIRNGIYGDGIETNHLQGGDFRMEVRLGCKGAACFRTTLDMSVGHLLNQGNPECDGTEHEHHHLPMCPRQGNISGSGVMGFLVEFPRRRQKENDLF